MLRRTRKFTLPIPLTEKDATPKERENKKLSFYKGLLLAMMSGVCFSISSVVVKKMNTMHVVQLTLYRFIAMLVFSMPSAVKCQENLLGPKEMRFSLVLCGILGCTNGFLNFIAFRYLPIGEATVIIFSVPAFVAVAARLILKEPLGAFQSIAVLVTFVGIIFTTKLPLKLISNSASYTTESLYGITAAIVSPLFCTWRVVLIRKIKSVHHSIIMFNISWLGVFGSLFLTVIIGNFAQHDCGFGKVMMIVFGLVNYTGQTWVIMSLQCEMAAPVSIMYSTVEIVMAFMWQIILFHDVPDALSITGAVLVVFSVIIVGLSKWATSFSPGSPYMKYIGWMTK